MPKRPPSVIYVSIHTGVPPEPPAMMSGSGYAWADTGWDASETPIVVDTAPRPKPPRQIKTIWQHLKEAG